MTRNLGINGTHYRKELIQLMSDSNVLNAIIEGVLADVEKRFVPISQLREQIENAPRLRGAYESLNQSGMRLIAEVKRSSPSKGELASIPDPQLLAEKYQEGGADLISVLTEERRFKGSIADLISVRSAIDLPVLRKDFIVTEFQVLESRIFGADLILLIVAGLSKSQLNDFYQLSTELGMDVLVEIHDLDEADEGMVSADQSLLTRALFNVLENAIKYSPAGGAVEPPERAEQMPRRHERRSRIDAQL